MKKLVLKTLSILTLLTTLLVYSTDTLAIEAKEQSYLLSWIPTTCCVTNECCWEIQESEIKLLPDQEAEVKSTGQVRKYLFSPDQKFYRCACDYDNENKFWNKHQGANTRCLFVPNRGM